MFIVMDNGTSQTEELLALQSIYDAEDLIIENENPARGRFTVTVQLPKPFYIVCKKYASDDVVQFEVDYLPQISLCFEFPLTYPSQSCPAFLLSCNWLTRERLTKLCRKLDSIWAESYGEVILFSWINFLQDETLNFLNIGDILDITDLCWPSEWLCRSQKIIENKSASIGFDKMVQNEQTNNGNVEQKNCDQAMKCSEDNAVSYCKTLVNIKPRTTGGDDYFDCRAVLDISGNGLLSNLKEYNLYKKQEAFKNRWITCQICYISKRGTDFQPFSSCSHNFCCDCLKSYFEVQIRDGNVHSLNCPEEGCSSQADGTLVKNLVCKELYEKYDSLLLSRTLEGMSDIAYCPRQQCQTPLLLDLDSRIGTCPLCSFAFCVFCQKSYHGIAPCNFKNEEKKELYKRYQESNSQERAELERRYGKRELKFLVENIQSEEWVECNSKKCPHCHSQIEKTDGCNKMTCYRCGKYFCWLCGLLLKSSNPYSHFSDITSKCYNQLFPENYDFAMPGEYLDF